MLLCTLYKGYFSVTNSNKMETQIMASLKEIAVIVLNASNNPVRFSGEKLRVDGNSNTITIPTTQKLNEYYWALGFYMLWAGNTLSRAMTDKEVQDMLGLISLWAKGSLDDSEVRNAVKLMFAAPKAAPAARPAVHTPVDYGFGADTSTSNMSAAELRERARHMR